MIVYKNLQIKLRKICGLTALLLVIGLDGCNQVEQAVDSPTLTPTPTANSTTTDTSSTPNANSTTTDTSSTSNSVAAIADRPLVVATNTVVCNLIQKIAVSTVDLKCLSNKGATPQPDELPPEDIQAIEQAKLILYSSNNLAPSLSKLIQTTANPAPKVIVDDVANTQSEVDGQTVSNPDVPTAENAINIAEVIDNSLSQLKPDLTSLYTTNTQKITNELTQINSGSESEMATLRDAQRKLAIAHQLSAYLNPTPWPEINPRARLTRVPAIMYHDIVPKKLVFFDVTQEEFEQHLQRLQSSGVTPISVDQLVTHLRTGLPLPEKPVLLTFDDGYESAYEYVFPLLKKYNYPAAFAIYTLNVGKNTGRDHVTWDQLREMAVNPLVTIMAHSVTHPNDLTVLPDDQLRTEVMESKRLLETQLGIPIPYFVYPAGKYDSRAEKLVQEAGYEAALTMNDLKDRFAGESKNLLAINRIGQSRLPYVVTQAWGGPKLSSWAEEFDVQSSGKLTTSEPPKEYQLRNRQGAKDAKKEDR